MVHQVRVSVLLFMLLLLTISACSAGADLSAKPGSPATPTPEASPTPAGPTVTPSSLPLAPTSGPTSEFTSTPTLVPTPTGTPTPTPTVTPTSAPVLQQLTRGECCTQPFWAPDSTHVLFIDRPDPAEPAGLWAVSVDNPFAPFLFSERIALYSDDLRYLVDSDGQTTFIERLPDAAANDPGARWQVPAGGGPVSFSPSQTRIAWQTSNNALAVETRVTQIWIANLDGTDPQNLVSLPRGGFVGWITDDRLLLTGRESLSTSETILWYYDIPTGTQVELVRGERVRGPTLSPDGIWLVYYETFGEPAENGLWIVRTDGSRRFPLARELFGAYQWRDSDRLLIIPFDSGSAYHLLWEFDVESGLARQLTEPALTPFKIAGGDWSVSPNGRQLVFVESSDRNLWLLTLGD